MEDTDDLVTKLRQAVSQLEELRDMNDQANTLVAFTDTTYQSLVELLAGAAHEIVAWRQQVASALNQLDDIAASLTDCRHHASIADHAARTLAGELTRHQRQLEQLQTIAHIFWSRLATTGSDPELDAALHQWETIAGRHD